MSAFDDLQRLRPNTLAFAIAAFLSVVAPGVLVLHLFRPDLIASLDALKLILFCAALTMPVVIVNFFSIVVVRFLFPAPTDSQPASDADRAEALIIAMCLAFIVFYAALLIAYLAQLQFKMFLLSGAAVQVLVFVVNYLVARAEAGHRPLTTRSRADAP